MSRFSLRNQDKIKKSLGDDFLKWLLLSLKEHFNKNDKIIEFQLANDTTGYKIIYVDNVQPNTDSLFELYVINKTFDVYNLAYKSCMG